MGSQYNAKTVAGGHSTVTINDNLTDIEDALDRSLSRYPDSPNEMQSDLDMNGFCILNLDPSCILDLLEECPPLEVLTVTSDTTIAEGNDKDFIAVNSANPVTITLPSDASDPGISIGAHLTVFREGTGTVTFVAGAGATLNSTGTQIFNQFEAVTVIKYAANTWTVLGNLL